MKKTHKRYGSISTRFLLLILCVLLGLVATQLALFGAINRLTGDELLLSAQSNVIYLRESLEETVQTLREEASTVFDNAQIRQMLIPREFRSSADYYTDVNEVQQMLSLIARANPMTESVCLYIPPRCISIGSGSVLSYHVEAEMNSYLEQVTQHPGILLRDGQICVAMPCLNRYSNKSSIPFVLEFTLSSEALRNSLSAYAAYNNQMAYMLDHQTGTAFCSTGLSTVPDVSALDRQETQQAYHFATELDGQRYTAVACYSSMDVSFVQLIAESRLNYILRRSAVYLGILALVALLGLLWYSRQVNWLIGKPTQQLIEAFSRAGQGEFSAEIVPEYADEFNRIAVHFNKMQRQLQALIQENYAQVLRIQRSRYKQLQAQISPHFLYNSLFLVRHMIDEDPAAATELVAHLTDFYRYITRIGQDEALFEEEYRHALHYIRIQQQRFDLFLNCDFAEPPAELATLCVPRLILQPILENAFVHCPPSPEHPLHIHMTFARTADAWIVDIENNGALDEETISELRQRLHTRDSELRETTGLVNICLRLRFFTDGRGDLSVERGKGGGLLVRLKLPVPQDGEQEGEPCTGF